jgi:methionyl-tRNA formyltransferase
MDLFNIPHYNSLKNGDFIKQSKEADMVLSVSAREMIPQSLIKATTKGIGLNTHPYLYAYKGADPIGRAIEDKNWKASVATHHLTDVLDSGEVVCELFKQIKPAITRDEVYSQIYLLYCEVVVKTLRDIK